MGRWSRAQLDSAFAQHEQLVVEIGKSWDWWRYADEFTEDALYVEHALGTFRGREQIREWIVSTMNTFPGSEMPLFPTTWHAIDDEKGWVFSEVRNRMKDPGRRQRARAGQHHDPQVRRRRAVELRGRRLQPTETS